MTLEELIRKYYAEDDYNCAETLLRAANDFYELHLHDEDMNTMAGFGGGMFIGSTCGALVGSIAAISKMVVQTKAHDTNGIRALMQTCNRNFKEELGALDCAHVKAQHHSKETGCLQTCLLAAKALEKTVQEAVNQ